MSTIGEIAKITVDDPQKDGWWFNRNYFFAGTGAVIFVLVMLYGIGGNAWMDNVAEVNAPTRWNDSLNYNNILRGFLNSFGHLSWLHLLGNSVSFLIMGMYLERKLGTIKLLCLILALAFFTSSAIGANHLSNWWAGFSGVNFGLKFFIGMDCIFTLANRRTRTKVNVIFCSIVLVWILIIFSVEIDPTFTFRIYPWRNMGHSSGALAGLVFGLIYQVLRIEQRAAAP